MSNSMNEENAGFTISVDYTGHQALVGALVNVVGRTASLVTLALIEMERLERKSGMLTADGWFVFTLRHVCKATGLRPRQVRSALRRMAKGIDCDQAPGSCGLVSCPAARSPFVCTELMAVEKRG